jgi:hypothetical protein
VVDEPADGDAHDANGVTQSRRMSIASAKSSLRAVKLNRGSRHPVIYHFPLDWRPSSNGGLTLWCCCDECTMDVGSRNALQQVYLGWRWCDGSFAKLAVKVFGESPFEANAYSEELATLRVLDGLPIPPSPPVVETGKFVDVNGYPKSFIATSNRDRDLSLRQFLLGGPGPSLEPGRRLAVARGLLRAVAVCHEAGVVHRALTPDRIFVDGAGAKARPLPSEAVPLVEMSDFEGMPDLNSARSQRPEKPSIAWWAPPQFNMDGTPRTHAMLADRWALSLIVYEILQSHISPSVADSVPRLIADVCNVGGATGRALPDRNGRPLGGPDVFWAALAHRSAEPGGMWDLRPKECPPWLWEFTVRLLREEASGGFASVSDALRAFPSH